MKKIKFKVILTIGYPGATRIDELELEVAENAGKEEIQKKKEEMATEWADNFIDLSWT
jgi:hypothetical protein